MNYKLIIAGLVFLFNPEINIIDIMPDFIGILLIMKGVSPVASVSPSMEAGYTSLKNYTLVSLVKTLVLVPLVTVASSDPAFYLLFTFAFSLVGLLFLLPASKNIFASIDGLSGRYAVSQKGTKLTDIVFSVFFIIKAVCPVLPELVYLYLPENILTDMAIYPLAVYKLPILLITFALSLVFGIVWLILAINYFSALKRNTEFNKALLLDISNVVHSRVMIINTSVSKTVIFMTLAVFSTLSLYVDGMRIIPILLCPVFLLFAYKNAAKLTTANVDRAKKSAVLALVACSVSFISSSVYHTKYHKYASMVFSRVDKQFILPAAIECISLFFIGIAVYRAYKVTVNIVEEHTGNFWERSFLTHNSFSAKERDGIKFRLKAGLYVGIVLTVSNAVSHCLLYIVPLYSIINSLINLAYGIYMTFIYLDIKSAVKEKYADIKTDKP